MFDGKTAVEESESDSEKIQRESVRGHQRVLRWQKWRGATRKERFDMKLPCVLFIQLRLSNTLRTAFFVRSTKLRLGE